MVSDLFLCDYHLSFPIVQIAPFRGIFFHGTPMALIVAVSNTLAAIRTRDSLRTGVMLLVLGWLALAFLLLTAPYLWLVTTFLDVTFLKIYTSIGLAFTLFSNLLWRSHLELAPGLLGPAANMFPHLQVLDPHLNEFRRIGASISYLVVVSCIWLAYLAAVSILERRYATGLMRPPAFKYILAGGLALGMTTLLWPGLFSTDIYLYAVQGKMQAVYGLNPLLDPPNVMGHDPLLALTPWRDIYSAYGPIWLAVAWAMSRLAQALGGAPVVYVLLFKTLNIGLTAICIRLIWSIGGQLDWPAGRRVATTMLFAWCPLLIIELEANSHNDLLLVVFILAAVWFHVRGMLPLAVAALVAGGLVKLPGFFLLPAYGVLLLRTSRDWAEAARRTILSVGVAIAVAFFAYVPYARPGVLDSVVANPMAGFATNSMGLLVRQAVIDVILALRGIITPSDLTWRKVLEAIRWPLWYGPLALWALMALIFSLRARDFTNLVRAWVLVMFSYLLIASVWFWPWYITWLMPVLVLLPPGRLRRAALLLAYGGSIHYAMLPILPLDPFPHLRFYYVPAAIFLPALAYCAWIGWKTLTNKRHGIRVANLTGTKQPKAEIA